jgi:hypothetical protein
VFFLLKKRRKNKLRGWPGSLQISGVGFQLSSGGSVS